MCTAKQWSLSVRSLNWLIVNEKFGVISNYISSTVVKNTLSSPLQIHRSYVSGECGTRKVNFLLKSRRYHRTRSRVSKIGGQGPENNIGNGSALVQGVTAREKRGLSFTERLYRR